MFVCHLLYTIDRILYTLSTIYYIPYWDPDVYVGFRAPRHALPVCQLTDEAMAQAPQEARFRGLWEV